MFQERFQYKGAAAYQPGVDLKNPIKCHGENKVES